jgi:hypothetical protein
VCIDLHQDFVPNFILKYHCFKILTVLASIEIKAFQADRFSEVISQVQNMSTGVQPMRIMMMIIRVGNNNHEREANNHMFADICI